MKLTLKKPSEFAPTRIDCFNEFGYRVATVACDGEVIFAEKPRSIAEIKQILVIAENFNLFKTNLQKD